MWEAEGGESGVESQEGLREPSGSAGAEGTPEAERKDLEAVHLEVTAQNE